MTWYAKPDYTKTFGTNCAVNRQRRHSFLPLNETSSEGSYNIKGEDHVSTTSERTSPGSTMRLMSSTQSSEGGDNFFDPTKPRATYGQQLPPSFVQSVGSQVFQPVIHEPCHPLFFSIPHGTIGVPSTSYSPVNIQPVHMSTHFNQKLQHPGSYAIQQCQQISQNQSHTRNLTASVPWMIAPVTYPQRTQQASVFPSTLSTPVSYFSSPGNVSNSMFINTPFISSATCTPITHSIMYHDTPPRLDLHNQKWQGSVYPQRISCNINGIPDESSGKPGRIHPQRISCNSNGIPDELASGKPGPILTNRSNRRLNNREAPRKSVLHERVEKTEKTALVSEEESLWKGNLDWEEYWFNGGSNLFISWSGPEAELVEKLQNFQLEVREVLRTTDSNICNVIFQTHPIARKAFTMQQRIRLRIVPPIRSHRIWFRNPSPTFLVKYETKCRLVVRRGKAECHGIVGELLKGCLITADQLKGNRIRVKCCEGSFILPGGKVVEMKGGQNNSEKNNSGKNSSLGWISYRCKYTNESFVARRSWNKLGDYIYNE